MLKPKQSPAEAFDQAWRNVLLYSEHTWGADWQCVGSGTPKTKEQWAIKQAYVTHADQKSRELIEQALKNENAPVSPLENEFDVFNTTSWPRTEVVLLSAEQSAGGESVVDERGKSIPSQRLTTGELAFIAKDVPPFAARRYRVTAGTAAS